MTGCQKKHENIDFIDLQQEGIISFSGSQNMYLQISVFAAVMFVEKKTLCSSTNTLIQPYAGPSFMSTWCFF